jgi:hypothetical protein
VTRTQVGEWNGDPIEVAGQFVPKYLWTTASIDVFVKSQCVLRTGGKWKLTGATATQFQSAGSNHSIELAWGRFKMRSFPIRITIDGQLIADTHVFVPNWPLSLWPLAASLVWLVWAAWPDSPGPDRAAEKLAVATPEHPFAGFWKTPGCNDRWGLAIAPSGPGFYSVSFCGPGGCFEPGTYRPNTRLVGDPAYRVINADVIEVSGTDDFSRYVRCKGR